MTVKNLANRQDIHFYRKFWHILFGVLAILFYYLNDYSIVELRWLALFIAIIAFVIDGLRLKNEGFNKKVISLFSPIMRRSEENSFSGLPFYALGVTTSLFFYEADIAILSILFLVFADPFAALIGVIYGKEKILGAKTLEGTIAAFFACTIITYIYIFDFNSNLMDSLLFSILCGIVGSLSELVGAFNLDDNLTVPVLSGAGIFAISYFFKALYIPI